MNVETPQDLFEYQLEDMYNAEKQLVDALDEAAGESGDEELERGFEEHRRETERHVERLEEVFEALGRLPDERTSPVMEGLADARAEFDDAAGSQDVTDLFLLGAGIKTERFEISGYEGLLELAEEFDMGEEVTGPLERNLEEERETLETLEEKSQGRKIEEIAS